MTKLRISPKEREVIGRRILDGSVTDAHGCWIWQGSTKNGYGQTSVRDRSAYTHRLSYEIFVGSIPEGMYVCHMCDVRRCNNPHHLFLGTHAENLADMRAKGRDSKPPIRCGALHHKARLSDAQVAEIRSLVAAGAQQREVAAQFGCSQSTVWRLLHGITRQSA